MIELHLSVFGLFIFIEFCDCILWKNGVVHYALNKKDYDPHSQAIILSTFSQIEREICVKFFNRPLNYNDGESTNIVYVTNPDKRKDCPPQRFDYNNSVIDMQIGYKCLNQQDIARITMDMLKASVDKTVTVKSSGSWDMARQFQDLQKDRVKLLSPADRNYINAAYYEECTGHHVQTRRSGDEDSVNNDRYYENKLWPLGVVLYGMEESLKRTVDYAAITAAMKTIESASCVVFQYVPENDALSPKNFLWFSSGSDELPELGFKSGNQTISLHAMAAGAPGHTAHTLSMLLRVLGMPMVSNRYDRDNYVTINWKNVEKTKEYLLERVPEDALLLLNDSAPPYDFESATHAPANYMCRDCRLGDHTVRPIRDHLWANTMAMGHRTDLSSLDIEILQLMYGKQCQLREQNQQ